MTGWRIVAIIHRIRIPARAQRVARGMKKSKWVSRRREGSTQSCVSISGYRLGRRRVFSPPNHRPNTPPSQEKTITSFAWFYPSAQFSNLTKEACHNRYVCLVSAPKSAHPHHHYNHCCFNRSANTLSVSSTPRFGETRDLAPLSSHGPLPRDHRVLPPPDLRRLDFPTLRRRLHAELTPSGGGSSPQAVPPLRCSSCCAGYGCSLRCVAQCRQQNQYRYVCRLYR